MGKAKPNRSTIMTSYASIVSIYQGDTSELTPEKINRDIADAITLSQQSQDRERPFALEPSVAELFFSAMTKLVCSKTRTDIKLYDVLEKASLKLLCTGDEHHQQAAVAALTKQPFSQAQLKSLCEAYVAEVKSKEDVIENRVLFSLLFSVPQHADFFKLKDLKGLFCHEVAEESFGIDWQWIVLIACSNAELKEELRALLKKGEYSAYRDALMAINLLPPESLEKILVQSSEGAEPLITDYLFRLQAHAPAYNLVKTGSEASIFWVFTKAAEQGNQTLLKELVHKCAEHKPDMLFKALAVDEIFEAIDSSSFNFLYYGYGISKETTRRFIATVMGKEGYIESQDGHFLNSLLLATNLKEFKALLAKPAIVEKLQDYPHQYHPDQIIFNSCNTSTAKEGDERVGKAEYFLANHADKLKYLQPGNLLALAVDRNAKCRMSFEQMVGVLKSDAFRAQQYSPINSSRIDRALLRGLPQNFFQALMEHDIYKEMYIREVVADELWDQRGQGFFCKKVPATILKAREFLEEKGYSQLSSEDLKTLLDMFKTASQSSHNYLLFDLRHQDTQQFYDKVATIPDVVVEGADALTL